MSDSNWPDQPALSPIPSMFHSLASDGPFDQCLHCRRDFLQEGVTYLIERVFRASEPILEYAMCLACYDNMRDELSPASLDNIQHFLEAKVDFDARLQLLHQHAHDDDVSPWVDKCLVTGKDVKQCRGYQVIALCHGGFIERGVFPLMLSDDAVEAMSELLSRQTRERLDDFIGTNFGMPPEFCQPPEFSPVFF